MKLYWVKGAGIHENTYNVFCTLCPPQNLTSLFCNILDPTQAMELCQRESFISHKMRVAMGIITPEMLERNGRNWVPPQTTYAQQAEHILKKLVETFGRKAPLTGLWSFICSFPTIIELLRDGFVSLFYGYLCNIYIQFTAGFGTFVVIVCSEWLGQLTISVLNPMLTQLIVLEDPFT
jgi:hypothetical protein